MTTRKPPGAAARAATLLIGLAACGDMSPELPVTRGAVLPPLAVTFTPSYAVTSRFIDQPAQIEGHAYLRVDQDGAVAGALSAGSSGRARLTPVTGVVDGDSIVLDPGEVYYASSERIGWDEIRLDLRDQDGDRAPDGASGHARGTWSAAGGDVVDSSPYTATIAATTDTSSTSAVLDDRDRRLPFGVVTIKLAEPVRDDQLKAALRLRAGGVAVAGSFLAGTFDDAPVDGLITGVRFQPDNFLPFDQPLSLDLGGLSDPSGNALTAAPSTVRVVPDPESVTNNLGFERGLTGWAVVGTAEDVGSFAGIAPAEGAHQAAIHAVGTLAAYVDVPADAGALHVSITRLAEHQEVASDYTAVVALHRAGGETIVGFDAREVADDDVACATCGTDYAFRIGPLTRDIDLTPLRGERVWLTVEARSYFFIGMPKLAVLVDDLRVVTSP